MKGADATMRNKMAGYTIIFSICLSLLVPVGSSRAADARVKVTLPNFTVKLNGNTVENQYREYPLLVYKDITYFPMTWYDSRLLGIETNWSAENGLNIMQSLVTSSYMPNKTDRRNSSTYLAEVPVSTVKINDKIIDNSREEYPMLSFRDVRYFPMTWRFAHDEFGWNYQWDATAGLSITSHNPQLEPLGLPSFVAENDVALFKGYYYFVETTDRTNHIYMAPQQEPSNKKEIYSYNFTETDIHPKPVSFQIRENTLWFKYHLGGGFTGQDNFVKISNDGKAELIYHGYLDFRNTSYGTLVANLGDDNGSGNLYLIQPNQENANRKSVGEESLRFAEHATNDKVPSTATTVVGDDAYVLYSNGSNFIYKINIKTDKTEKVVNSGVNWFRIINGKLYYVKSETSLLYSSSLDGSGETKLSEHAVSWFGNVDDNIFYTTKKDVNQFELYKVISNAEDSLVWKTPVTNVQMLNGRIVCRLGENDDYGAILLDGSGHLLLSVADQISRVLTSDEGILLQTSKDSSIKLIR